MYKVDHHFFGEIEFVEKGDEETHCLSCLHINICHSNMSMLCVNYSEGRTKGHRESCTSCHHFRTRSGGEGQAIKCFLCREKIPKSDIDLKGYKTYREKNAW